MLDNVKRKYTDITNQKFNRLTAIQYLGKPKAHSMWKCLCDCGNTSIVTYTAIVNSRIKSCGCIQKGRKAPNKMKEGEAAANSLLAAYKTSAKKRKLDFNLTREKFLELVKEKCDYCGCQPAKIKKTVNSDSTGTFVYNGIDRLNNFKGYTIENCVPCCTRCNVAKHDMSLVEFSDWIGIVNRRLNG